MKNFKLIISLVVFFGLTSCVSVKKESKPRLHVRNANIDLNQIDFDSTSHFQYTLVNTGDATLVIDTVSASCGCTIPELFKKTIEPKDSTTLYVDFKPVEKGNFKKSVVIRSNVDSAFSIVTFRGQAVD
jgi:hypothetical protein